MHGFTAKYQQIVSLFNIEKIDSFDICVFIIYIIRSMNMMTLKQMQYLIAVIEEQSFSKAAQRCFVTQSTLSAGVKEAETLLGQQLIDRSKRQPALTAFGSEVIEQVRAILETAEKITVKAKQYQRPMSAPIRVGIIPTIAPYMLPNVLPELDKLYPDLDLHIHEDLSDRIVSDMMQGRLDMIVLAFPFSTPGAEQYPLFEEEFYLASLKQEGTPSAKQGIHSDDLNPNDLLLLADGHCLTDHALQACSLQRPAHRQTYSASSLTTLIQMVGHGMGQTLLPAMVVEGGQLPDHIQTQRFVNPAPKRTIGMAWRKNAARMMIINGLGI